MRISDWSSDVCSSDLQANAAVVTAVDFDRFNAIRLRRRLAADQPETPRIAVPDLGRPRHARRRVEHNAIRLPKTGGHDAIVGRPTPSTEERRVGDAGVSTCRHRWSTYH